MLHNLTDTENQYNLAHRNYEEVLDYCTRENIGFIPWFPLATGDLTKPHGALVKVARAFGATPAQASSWVSGLAIATALSGLWLSVRYRMPIITAWSTPGAALIASTSGVPGIGAAVGAFVLAAILILLTAAVRPLGRLIERIPTSIAAAMLAGILVGPHEGASLEALDVAMLAGLLANIDEESRALLATYLDRRDPAWREHAQGDAAAGRGAAPRGGPMTEQEAYQIRGLEPGANAEEIGRAHRSLMKKLHPDQGGTTYLAARINEAKDTLLRRHR